MRNYLGNISHYILFSILLIIVTGCTSIPKDLGRSDVKAIVSERGLSVDTDTSKSRDELVNSLVAKPLTADSAIRIALVNNPRLTATYASLGVAAADVYEAGRIRNPIFSFTSLDSNVSGESNLTTFGLITSFTDLITLPARKRFAEGEFAAMKQSIGAEVLNIAAGTEDAFYHFVGAKQVATLRAQIAKAGELSLELAKRYYDAGNLTPRDFALKHAAASESQLASLEAAAEAYGKRAELATFLGLSLAGAWDSPAKLPVPLDQEDGIDELLILAQQSRLDLAAAVAHTDLLADRLGVTNWTRWLGELDVGIEHERETDDAQLTGPTIEWEIPIFTQNRDKQLRADAELKIAIAEVERLTIAVENGVRLAYAATQNTKARVNEYHERLIPARIEAVARTQEEENFMLIGIFELLETKQQEYDAYQGYLEVVRDYWLARTELARVVGNTLPSSVHVGKEHLDVEEYLTPKPSGVDHSGHAGMQKDSSMSSADKDNADAMSVDHSKHNLENNSNKITAPKNEHDAHSEHLDTYRRFIMTSRREFLTYTSAGAVAAAVAPVATAESIESVVKTVAVTKQTRAGQSYIPVRTLNGWTLPYKMKNGVKEFHLVAEEIEHEFAPGSVAKCWGYNGTTPGPTIEAVEGDRVRILVTNCLKEHTTIHWHGLLLPSGMDGVGGLSQPQIAPGETFAYEFTLQQHGTQMYHPHADEMVQMAVGMMGMFIIHPRDGEATPVDRDYCFLTHNWAMHPGTYRPDPSVMVEFDLWTFNSKVFPMIDPVVARTGERVRVRIGNLSMWNHPIHMHGVQFWVTGSDGGRWSKSRWRPEVTEIVGVGQTRDIEFIATPGDWAFHCHMSHHTMNAMGHGIPNTLGVDQSKIDDEIRNMLPGFIAMGRDGMAEHQEHVEMGHHQGPENTLAMMTGKGPHGNIEMGGMFTTVKVRDDIKPGDYSDPGWYKAPVDTVAKRISSDPEYGDPVRFKLT